MNNFLSLLNHLQLGNPAQGQITFGQKISGATSRVENFQRREFFLKGKQIFLAVAIRSFDLTKLIAQFV